MQCDDLNFNTKWQIVNTNIPTKFIGWITMIGMDDFCEAMGKVKTIYL